MVMEKYKKILAIALIINLSVGWSLNVLAASNADPSSSLTGSLSLFGGWSWGSGAKSLKSYPVVLSLIWPAVIMAQPGVNRCSAWPHIDH